jgi:hypothetical protein
MTVRCNADCNFCKDGKCQAEEIRIEDVEQSNIKFLENDYMSCKTLTRKEY